MKTKLLTLACLLMCANGVMAHEIGNEIYDKQEGARVFGKIGIITREGRRRDEVEIYTVSKKTNPNPQNFFEVLSPIQTIDKKLWTITLAQLPITDDDCWNLAGQICDANEKNCYQHCIQYPDPKLVAFDEKNQKVYLKYPTATIGVTGEGPALLFSGDINTKTLKLIGRGAWLEDGSLSPSGRYLILYGSSAISVYVTQTNSWFDTNKPKNIYSSYPEVRHYLQLKQWDSDTQFTYLDVSRHFTCDACDKPFLDAKEIKYDVVAKAKVYEKSINEKEYEKMIKNIQNKN